eukprot:3033737-Pyramimonas_sp.AAC.1
MSHCIWVYALASQSSIRVANKALRFVSWAFFARFSPLRRAPPQALPPRGGAGSLDLPWRGPWLPRIRLMQALKAVRASATGARARSGEPLRTRPRRAR